MKRIKSFLVSKITVDTIAFAIFSLLTSVGLTTIYELLVLKMDNDDWFLFRIIYNILKFSGAYFCAELTDIIRKKIQKNPNNLSQKITADTLAVSIYQLPIYNITGYFEGAADKTSGKFSIFL